MLAHELVCKLGKGACAAQATCVQALAQAHVSYT